MIDDIGTYNMDEMEYHYPRQKIKWSSRHVDMRPHVNGVQYNFINASARVKEQDMVFYWATWQKMPEYNTNVKFYRSIGTEISVERIINCLNRYPKSREMSFFVRLMNQELKTILAGRAFHWDKSNKEWRVDDK